jgi:hypothetical protein
MCRQDSSIIDTLLHNAIIKQSLFQGSQAMPNITLISFNAGPEKINNLYKSSLILIEVFLHTPSGTNNDVITIEQKLKLSVSGDLNIYLD